MAIVADKAICKGRDKFGRCKIKEKSMQKPNEEFMLEEFFKF